MAEWSLPTPELLCSNLVIQRWTNQHSSYRRALLIDKPRGHSQARRYSYVDSNGFFSSTTDAVTALND